MKGPSSSSSPSSESPRSSSLSSSSSPDTPVSQASASLPTSLSSSLSDSVPNGETGIFPPPSSSISSSSSVVSRFCSLGYLSPFRESFRVYSYVSSYLSFFLGGCFALEWRALEFFPRWLLRVLTFSWGGLLVFVDFFRIPSAVRHFQRRRQKAYIREELQARLSVCESLLLSLFRKRKEGEKDTREEKSLLSFSSPKKEDRCEEEKKDKNDSFSISSSERKKDEGSDQNRQRDLSQGVEKEEDHQEKEERNRGASSGPKDNETKEISLSDSPTCHLVPRDSSFSPLSASSSSSSSCLSSSFEFLSFLQTSSASSKKFTSHDLQCLLNAYHIPPDICSSFSSSLVARGGSEVVSKRDCQRRHVLSTSSLLITPPPGASCGGKQDGDKKKDLGGEEKKIKDMCEERSKEEEARFSPAGMLMSRLKNFSPCSFKKLTCLRLFTRAPWMMMLRGLHAHVVCCYVVDIIFCNAQLSPLSEKIPRCLFLLLHIFFRSLGVYAATFSDLTGGECISSSSSGFSFFRCFSPPPMRSSAFLWYSFFLCLVASSLSSLFLMCLSYLGDLIRVSFPLIYESYLASDFFPAVALTLDSVKRGEKMPLLLKDDFYFTGQLIGLVLIAVSVYQSTRAHEEIRHHMKKEEVAYAKDLLALLALLQWQKEKEDQEEEKKKIKDNQERDKEDQGEDARKKDVDGEDKMKKEEKKKEEEKELLSVESGEKAKEEKDRKVGETAEEKRKKDEEMEKAIYRDERIVSIVSELYLREGVEEISSSSSFPSSSSFSLSPRVDSQKEEDMKKRRTLLSSLRRRRRHPHGWIAKELFSFSKGFVISISSVVFIVLWVSLFLLSLSNVALRIEDQTITKVFDLFTGEGEEGFFEKTSSSSVPPEIHQLKEELKMLYDQFRYLEKKNGIYSACEEMLWMLFQEIQYAIGETTKKKKVEEDSYTLLGLKKSATARDIKRAYKELAKQFHPDVISANSSQPLTSREEFIASERMRKINEAYERLMKVHGGRGNLGRDS